MKFLKHLMISAVFFFLMKDSGFCNEVEFNLPKLEIAKGLESAKIIFPAQHFKEASFENAFQELVNLPPVPREMYQDLDMLEFAEKFKLLHYVKMNMSGVWMVKKGLKI